MNHRDRIDARRIARRTACIVLLTTVVLLGWSSLAFADVWTDISDATWQSVYHVSAQDASTVADGYPDGTFRPNNPVTRGQFAKMVSGGLAIPTLDPATPTFTDVPPNYLFYVYIEGDAAAGVIHGYPDHTYRPGLDIIRQQANSILGQWLSQAEILETGGIAGTDDNYPTLDSWYAAEGEGLLAGFADQAQVLPIHRATTAYLILREVVQGSASGGKKYLKPLDKLSRAQAVAMTLRVGDAADAYMPQITDIDPQSGPLAGVSR